MVLYGLFWKLVKEFIVKVCVIFIDVKLNELVLLIIK